MAIVALDAPDFRTISEFRRRHLGALSALFVQVLERCERAGLVKLGHVALDGTKIKANASKHKAMSYARMSKRAAELQAEVDGWLEAAEAADAAEDTAFGADKRGDEMPDWVANKQARLAKIREAKADLEAEVKAKAAAEQAARENHDDKPRRGREAAPPAAVPEPKAQRNFTDPESRILKTRDGYIQGYNAQAAVDAHAQIIVAQTLSNNGSDQAQFAPLLDSIKANLKRNPDEASADAGYCSAANLRTLSRRRIRGYIATGRQKHGSKSATTKRPATPGLAPRQDDHPAQARRPSQPLPAAQAGGRTGVRTDQAGERVPPVPVTGNREGEGRMGDDLHRPQPSKARAGYMSATMLA